MPKGLDEAIVCIVDWYMGAIMNADRVLQYHLDNEFRCFEWENIQEVYSTYPYDNPFSWDFTCEHLYMKRSA